MSLPRFELLLRLSVAFAFIYPPLAAIRDPYAWLGYFPTFLPATELMLHSFGVIEIALALWILIGKRIAIPSVVAGLLLLSIVIANPLQFDILFRDVSIALACFALAGLHLNTRPPG